MYLSTLDGKYKFEKQNLPTVSTQVSGFIDINKDIKFQDIVGFGFTLTGASADLLSKMSDLNQNLLLTELFDPINGIGTSVLRVSIGASDLSSFSYTYDDINSSPPIGYNLSLQSCSCQKYVGCDMICAQVNPEWFTVIDAGLGNIALKGKNGKYVSGTSPMTCNATSIGNMQKFKWIVNGDYVSLMCLGNQKYVCSENGSGYMNCNRSSPSGWETFIWKAADIELNKFNIIGPELAILKKIIKINPNLSIIASPWSAPKWMKTNNNWFGGSLDPYYYQCYANYFVKYIKTMQANGIPIYAITPQNEPENPNNEPSMTMTKEEQVNFINNYLGPTFKNANINTKIIAYDHNCDNIDYPIYVLNNSSYVDGAAFHLYAGNITALGQVHDLTKKNVYFTEQWIEKNSDFGGTLGWHIENVMLGSVNCWSRMALEWNLASDPLCSLHTPGGCSDCLGAITIDGNNVIRNPGYYIVAHMSKIIKPGSIRIQSTCNIENIIHTVFMNGSNTCIVIYNKNMDVKNISIIDNVTNVISVPGQSIMSFII